MKATIKLDVPDWQIGKDVTVYFPDTMMKKAKCEAFQEQDTKTMRSLVHCKDCKHRPVKLSDGITLVFPDDECPYKAEDNDYSFYPDDLWFCANGEAVVNIPVNQVKTTTDYDTLIVGSCPVCGQARLNNRDNRMCGMCGAKLTWLEPYKLNEVDGDVGEE